MTFIPHLICPGNPLLDPNNPDNLAARRKRLEREAAIEVALDVLAEREQEAITSGDEFSREFSRQLINGLAGKKGAA